MKLRNWIALAAGTLLALGIAYAAYSLADYSWAQVVDYRGPYARVRLPATQAPTRTRPAESERVVYVIVDGLREDVSRSMPTLEALRARGFDAVVRTAQPSLSFPGWTALLSGAPQRISGVTTNWFTQRVPVETLVDVALRAGRPVAVSAPTDFEQLYGVKRTPYVFLRDWEKGSYMTGGIVDNAIRLAKESSATVVLVHFPDVDEAGHTYGGASREYRATAMRVDSDLARLVTALQDDRTAFVVTSDHGHIDTGGHGGPESVVTEVPAVFAGVGVRLGRGRGDQDQVAATVAMLAGLPVPRDSAGLPLEGVGETVVAHDGRFDVQQAAAYAGWTSAVSGDGQATVSKDGQAARAAFVAATEARLARERGQRAPLAAGVALAAVLVLVAIGLLSWRALVAALSGTAAYYLVYEGLFFVVHGYRWSLSAFNSEDLLKAFFNARMLEAAVAGIVAAAVAADVYLVTRRDPRRPTGEYLPGWLALGSATVLAVQATLALQVAWFLWWWGPRVSWILPDFATAFKYDLDLIQATALAGAAVLAPLVTWLVGRYHPIRSTAAEALTSGDAASTD